MTHKGREGGVGTRDPASVTTEKHVPPQTFVLTHGMPHDVTFSSAADQKQWWRRRRRCRTRPAPHRLLPLKTLKSITNKGAWLPNPRPCRVSQESPIEGDSHQAGALKRNMGHTVCARSWCSGTIVGRLKLNISGHSSDWSKLLNFPVGFQVSALSDRAARQPHCWQLLRHICGWMDQLNTGWNDPIICVFGKRGGETP